MPSKFDAVVTSLTSEEEFTPKWSKFLSLVFLLITCSFTFFTFTKPTWFFFQKEFTLKPGIVEAIIGITLVTPLYLRNILKWSMSIYGIISFILILTVFSSLITLAEGGDSSSIYTQALIFSAILLSWLGIRPLPGIAWILVLLACILNITSVSQAMGNFGYVYILSGFLGILLHSGLNPGQLYKEISSDFGKTWRNSGINGSSIKEEISKIKK